MEHRSQWGLQRCWEGMDPTRGISLGAQQALFGNGGRNGADCPGRGRRGAQTAGRRWSPSPSVPEICDALFLSAVFFRQLPKLQRGWARRVGYGRWGRWLLPPEGSSGQWEGVITARAGLSVLLPSLGQLSLTHGKTTGWVQVLPTRGPGQAQPGL